MGRGKTDTEQTHKERKREKPREGGENRDRQRTIDRQTINMNQPDRALSSAN